MNRFRNRWLYKNGLRWHVCFTPVSDVTSIQWAHISVNPITGCGGCEIFPAPGDVLTSQRPTEQKKKEEDSEDAR